MSDDFTPPTQPEGSLEPPKRRPPTAVAAATPAPLPQPRPRIAARRTHGLARWLSSALDLVDEVADIIGEALHLRRKGAASK